MWAKEVQNFILLVIRKVIQYYLNMSVVSFSNIFLEV